MRSLGAFIKRTVALFLWMTVGLFVGVLVTLTVDGIYEVLYKLMPSFFPLYNSVLEAEAYGELRLKLDTVAFILTAFVSVYLSLRTSNAREEWIISRTDGLFLIRDEIASYYKKYFALDAIASSAVAYLLSLPFAFIPKPFLESGNVFSVILNVLYAVISEWGLITFTVRCAAVLIVSHLLSAVLALRLFRARWLSELGEVR